MSDEELVAIASEFREGILEGGSSRGMCFMVSAPLHGLLSFHGVECDLVSGDLGDTNHFWLALRDGRVLDPTADQFNWFRPDERQMPPVYLGPPTVLHPLPLRTGGVDGR